MIGLVGKMGRNREVCDICLLNVLQQYGGVAISSEIADVIDFTNEGTSKRLHQLQGDGYVYHREAARNIILWRITPEGKLHAKRDCTCSNNY